MRSGFQSHRAVFETDPGEITKKNRSSDIKLDPAHKFFIRMFPEPCEMTSSVIQAPKVSYYQIHGLIVAVRARAQITFTR